MTYALGWGEDSEQIHGQRTVLVNEVNHVNPALDYIAADGGVYLLDVYEVPENYGLQIVWGNPDRAAMTWIGENAAWAYEPSLVRWPEDIRFDHGAAVPARTRLAPYQVRIAVCQYVHTGKRPTCVKWIPFSNAESPHKMQ